MFMGEKKDVYVNELPESVRPHYNPVGTYIVPVSVKGTLAIPDKHFFELEVGRLRGVAIAAARDHYHGDAGILELEAEVQMPPEIDKGIDLLANFKVSSARLGSEGTDEIGTKTVLAGIVDVEFWGYKRKQD
jgi:hypothetical protein